MPRHPYSPDCGCERCTREGRRREAQSTANKMLTWRNGRNRRRARIGREYWENFESGVPMSDDDR